MEITVDLLKLMFYNLKQKGDSQKGGGYDGRKNAEV